MLNTAPMSPDAGTKARRRLQRPRTGLPRPRIGRPQLGRLPLGGVLRHVASIVRAGHPRQALAFAVVVGTLVALMGRDLREVGVSAAAVLVVQLIAGLLNDVHDAPADKLTSAPRKPVAQGVLAAEDASFAAMALLLIAIPLSLQNGIAAGISLLATLPVAYVHTHWLRRTPLSFVGWAATFALVACFVTFGGWGAYADGAVPVTEFVVLAAVLGVCVHFLTSLPHLVADNTAGVRHLPLRAALRLGAPRLLLLSGIATVGTLFLVIYTALTAGIAR